MENPSIEYCTKISQEGIKNNLKNLLLYLQNLGFSDNEKTIITESLGFQNINTEYDPNVFYNCWKDNYLIISDIVTGLGETVSITNNGASISSSTSNREGICEILTTYNESIIHQFFCEKTPNFFDTRPLLGKYNQDNYIQMENIHYYFTHNGGNGLQKCKQDENSILYEFCTSMFPSNVNSEDQEKYISGNRDIYKWCGCYIDPSNFSVKQASGQTVCSPLCSYYDSIKLFEYADSGSTSVVNKQCNQTICAITDITMKVLNSEGKINFNQVCPGCSDGGNNCTCVIDSSVEGVLDKITTKDGNTQVLGNFKQVCPNANCLLADGKGGFEKLKCNTNNASNTNKQVSLGYNGSGVLRNITNEEKFTVGNYIIFMLFFIIFIIFIGLSFVSLIEVEFFKPEKKKKIGLYELKSNKYHKGMNQQKYKETKL